MQVLHLLPEALPGSLVLVRHVQRRCLAALAEGERARAAGAAEWLKRRQAVLAALQEALGPLELGLGARALSAEVVSRHEREHYRIENVLFEAGEGWQVNASLFLPNGDGPFPAVVQPCGHSAKWSRHYQVPAQVLARCGYACILFDAPWFGEKAALNDHYRNGYPCYLVGIWPERFFVLDALRAVDYLATRADIDMSRGVGMTGVSGGGFTTMIAGLLDERIACVAPACFSASLKGLTIADFYSPDAETVAPGHIGLGFDYIDWWAAMAPKPCLLMGGSLDEVFTEERVREVAAEMARIYTLLGFPERFRLFMDRSGHTYTFNMALECVRFLDCWLGGGQARELRLRPEEIEPEPPEALRCYPDVRANMFSLARSRAQKLARSRGRAAADVVAKLLGLSGRTLAAPQARVLEISQRWQHALEKLVVESEPGIPVPGLLLRRLLPGSPAPALLYLDEAGKWHALRRGGFLARAAGFLEESRIPGEAIVLSADVRGFGELLPQPSEYDLAPWCDVQCTVAGLGIGLGEPLLGMQVRDALACLQYLRSRENVRGDCILVGGRGSGAVVALHAAFLARWQGVEVAGVLCQGMPVCLAELVGEFPQEWGYGLVIPSALAHYDLPELAQALAPIPIAVVNPLDARRRPVAAEVAAALYGLRGGQPHLALVCGLEEREEEEWALRWLAGVVGQA